MKISVITMQAVYNYGSALQTYATRTYFEQKGHEVEFVDYYPRRMRNYGSVKQLYIDAKPFHKKPWKCLAAAVCKYPSMRALRDVFVPFSEKYIPKTRPYASNEELMAAPPVADVYCTGSDQVWNDYLEGEFDKAYFLDFAPKGSRKIAYAASFGRDDIAQAELAPVKELLESYSAISVRETSGLDILKDVSVPSKACVTDPTFMLDGEAWKKLAAPIEEKNYILVYKLHEDSITSEAALAIGRKTGKKVIRLSSDYLKRLRGGKTVVAPRVEEFISYILNADLVVTDSFHATAFSVNMGVPFISVRWKMFNDRIDTILHKTGLERRSAATVEDALRIASEQIDFTHARLCLDRERAKTDEFITAALQ